MKFEMSFEPIDVSKDIYYPIRKDIMDKVHPSRLDLFIRDLLLEVSKYPEVWDPTVINGRRTDIWRVIKDVFRSNPWGGFNTPTTLLEKAEAIFYDQRYQFYCDYIEYYQFVEGSTIDGYWFLQNNAPSDYDQLFKIVLKERLFYPECSPLRKSITYENKNNEQEDDVEEDLWVKMERENTAKDVEKASEARTNDTTQISENTLTTRTSFPKLSKDSNKAASNVKNWRSHVNENLRVLFVSELAKKLPYISPLEDCFVEEAKNYENEMFWKANNKEEYYRLFGDKLAELKMNLQVRKNSLETESVVSDEAGASEDPEYPKGSYDWSDGEGYEESEEDYYATSGGYEVSYSDTEVYLVKFGREETTRDAVISKQMARLGVDPVRTADSAATSSSMILNEREDVKTTEESEIAFEEPNYDDLGEGFFENTIVPAVVAAKKTIFDFGKIVIGKIKNILVEDGPKSEESSSSERNSRKQTEMNIMDSQGTETRNIRDAPCEVRDVQSDRIAPGSARRVQIQYPKSIEKRLSSKGHYYYVNLHNNTSSNQNPLGWKQLPEGWRQKLSSKRQFYYYNKVSRVTQWDRPTEESDLDFSNAYII